MLWQIRALGGRMPSLSIGTPLISKPSNCTARSGEGLYNSTKVPYASDIPWGSWAISVMTMSPLSGKWAASSAMAITSGWRLKHPFTPRISRCHVVFSRNVSTRQCNAWIDASIQVHPFLTCGGYRSSNGWLNRVRPSPIAQASEATGTAEKKESRDHSNGLASPKERSDPTVPQAQFSFSAQPCNCLRWACLIWVPLGHHDDWYSTRSTGVPSAKFMPKLSPAWCKANGMDG